MIQRYQYYKYGFAGLGAIFALTVVNPNYVKRRSWYLRKVNLALFGAIGYAFAARYQEDQITMTMLKMNDYLPLEVKRALQDKDFRHLALFDGAEVSKGRKLFDPVTGKSLS